MQAFTKIINPGVVNLGGANRANRATLFCKIQFNGVRLSITGVEGPTRNGNCKGACGQIAMHPWDMDRYAEGWNADSVARLRQVWHDWHLNDMQAGSPAQTAFLKANPITDRLNYFTSACAALETAGLQPDPGYLHNGKPYAYGTAWLFVPVPDDVLEFLASLPDSTLSPAWV